MDLYEFEASLVYKVSSRTARATQRNPVSENQTRKRGGERPQEKGEGETHSSEGFSKTFRNLRKSRKRRDLGTFGRLFHLRAYIQPFHTASTFLTSLGHRR